MVRIKFLEAQNGDCFLLHFENYVGACTNLLIDGGRRKCYADPSTGVAGELKKELQSLRENNQVLDLVILTHIDNDHIEGLLQWFAVEQVDPNFVKKIWFNSGKLIADFLKQSENKEMELFLTETNSAFTGTREAILFDEYLQKYGIPLDSLVLTEDELKLAGIEFQILSPGQNELENLWAKFCKEQPDAFTAGKQSDWGESLQSFVEEEKDEKFRYVEDTSCTNVSSISFILRADKFSFLFLGDVNPSQVIRSLKKLGIDEDNPLYVDLFKISHHGSKKNTNKELLKCVKTDSYLVSTDSSGDHHPNKRTLARIIDVNPTANIIFNYKHVAQGIMLAQDFLDFPEFKIQYLKERAFNG